MATHNNFVDENTLLITTSGLKKIKDIKKTDYVGSYNLKLKRIEYSTNLEPKMAGMSDLFMKVYINKPDSCIICTRDTSFVLSDGNPKTAEKLNRRNQPFKLGANQGMILSLTPVKEKYKKYTIQTSNKNFIVSVGGELILIGG